LQMFDALTTRGNLEPTSPRQEAQGEERTSTIRSLLEGRSLSRARMDINGVAEDQQTV
jgi:hypothetical protein